jgi:molecular chaperone GrpE
VVVRDKRRLDPDSGEVRPEATKEATKEATTEATTEAGSGQPGSQPDDEVAAVRAELTADLQRLSAEYSNYRKRVERDRVLVLEMATAGFLENLLPLLDSIELARQHGDLEGAFKGVGEGLEQLAERHGLERYGAAGEAFDPAIHNALMHAGDSPDVEVATVSEVLQPGWRLRTGRVLRPAGVAVTDPAEAVATEQPESAAVPEEDGSA